MKCQGRLMKANRDENGKGGAKIAIGLIKKQQL